jgi:predicted nuclease of predicted toxin-antitoxin system
MRFLLDANLSPRLGPILAADGHGVVHVLDLGLVNASDEAILSRALADGSVVITADSDFAMLLALRAADRPSVIQLRHVNELGTAEIGVLLTANLPTVTDALIRGAIVSLSPTRMAVRELPIR